MAQWTFSRLASSLDVSLLSVYIHASPMKIVVCDVDFKISSHSMKPIETLPRWRFEHGDGCFPASRTYSISCKLPASLVVLIKGTFQSYQMWTSNMEYARVNDWRDRMLLKCRKPSNLPSKVSTTNNKSWPSIKEPCRISSLGLSFLFNRNSSQFFTWYGIK